MPRRNKPLIQVARRLPMVCKKQSYISKQQIEQVIAERSFNEADVALDFYLCPRCGKWHLTSK